MKPWLVISLVVIAGGLGAVVGHAIGENAAYEKGYSDGYRQGEVQWSCPDGPGTCCAVPADSPEHGCKEASP